MNDSEMLKSWFARTRAIEKAHFCACVRFRKRHYVWGGLLMGTAALASALTGMAESGGQEWLQEGFPKFVRILLAIFVPVIAAMVTFLNYQVRSKDHHHAAAKFAALKRVLSVEISRRETLGTEHKTEKTYTTLQDVCKKWDELTENSPALYTNEWEADVRQYEKELGLPVHVSKRNNRAAKPTTTTDASTVRGKRAGRILSSGGATADRVLVTSTPKQVRARSPGSLLARRRAYRDGPWESAFSARGF